jgi:hypothetical protein
LEFDSALERKKVSKLDGFVVQNITIVPMKLSSFLKIGLDRYNKSINNLLFANEIDDFLSALQI